MHLPTLFTFFCLVLAAGVSAFQNYKQFQQNLNVETSYSLRDGEAVALEFTLTQQTKNTFRISVWSQDATRDAAIKVIVQQENRVTSWQVPVLIEQDNVIYEQSNSSRTLCFEEAEDDDATPNNRFTILLSTSSKSPISASIIATEVTDFHVRRNEAFTTSLTPSQPVYYSYTYRNANSSIVFIEIFSPSDGVCHTASVQNKICPVEDQATDIRYNGRYQTILTKGAMSIKKKQFPDGFFLVFQANVDDTNCKSAGNSNDNITNREATITFSILENSQKSPMLKITTIIWYTILICLGVCCLCVLNSFCFYCFGTYSANDKHKENDDMNARINLVNLRDTNPHCITNNPDNRNETVDLNINSDKVTMDQFSMNPRNVKKSKNYIWHIINVFIFYAVPVSQLMLSYQLDLNKTGNHDICYHNHYCSHPYGIFVDFNHILSNVAYIIFGLYFILYVWLRSKLVVNNATMGVPSYYGIYYAMGIALIFEGFLSGFYHICPTQANFQFDTSFMYIMVCLCTLKLYQNRHPNINASAYTTFFVIGFYVFFAMAGLIFSNHKIVMIVFQCLNLILSFYISLKFYYFQKTFKWIYRRRLGNKQRISDDDATILPKNQWYILIFINLLNFALAVTAIILYPTTIKDFGSVLLYLLIGYSAIYLIFYICMKLYYEKAEGLMGFLDSFSFETVIYKVLAIIFWCNAMSLFNDRVTDSKLTPAESREHNAYCIWFGYYDNHDAWHLLSAPALFFSFMGIITIDNNMIFASKKNVVVF